MGRLVNWVNIRTKVSVDSYVSEYSPNLPPIYRRVMDEARCGAASQMVNGCAAHSSRRLLTRRPKTCPLFALTTTKIGMLVRLGAGTLASPLVVGVGSRRGGGACAALELFPSGLHSASTNGGTCAALGASVITTTRPGRERRRCLYV